VLIDNEVHYLDERTILVDIDSHYFTGHKNFIENIQLSHHCAYGSNETKELIQVVLAKNMKTKATVGNLNNHIGVPLTLLSFNAETEIGIVEMGPIIKRKLNFFL
jgi:UDP-N-acetylmuramoyl-tripeptide--D-alanyl-D-alanine ligase